MRRSRPRRNWTFLTAVSVSLLARQVQREGGKLTGCPMSQNAANSSHLHHRTPRTLPLPPWCCRSIAVVSMPPLPSRKFEEPESVAFVVSSDYLVSRAPRFHLRRLHIPFAKASSFNSITKFANNTGQSSFSIAGPAAQRTSRLGHR